MTQWKIKRQQRKVDRLTGKINKLERRGSCWSKRYKRLLAKRGEEQIKEMELTMRAWLKAEEMA